MSIRVEYGYGFLTQPVHGPGVRFQYRRLSSPLNQINYDYSTYSECALTGHHASNPSIKQYVDVIVPIQVASY